MPENDALLPVEERNVVLRQTALASHGVAVPQSLDDLVLQNRLLENVRNVFRLHTLVEEPVRAHDHDGAALAEPLAPGCLKTNPVAEPPLVDLSDQRVPNVGAICSATAGGIAQRYAGKLPLPGRPKAFFQSEQIVD